MKSVHPQSDQLQPRRPYRTYKRAQERISRLKLYRTTAIYTTYAIVLLVLAARAGHPYKGAIFFLVGVFPVWMSVEYFTHRYILHVHFVVSQKWWKHHLSIIANKFLDPMHFGHHERPFDGHHISGRVRDMLPLLIVFGIPSILFFPPYTASLVLAGFFMGYIAEEWIHHATHFFNFRDPYFRYMKKHHFYHHTSQGMVRGFGTTSGILDAMFGTRYPDKVRQRLYGVKSASAPASAEQPVQQV